MADTALYELAKAANSNKLTGVVQLHLIIAGRHVSGELVSDEDFAMEVVQNIAGNEGDEKSALTRITEAIYDHPYIHLRDAKVDGAAIGWFRCATSDVTGFSVGDPKPLTAEDLIPGAKL